MSSDFDPDSVPCSVFYPSSTAACQRLKNATLFTRISVRSTPEEVKRGIESTPGISNTFCLLHFNDVLIFDIKKEVHTTHVRSVLQMLRDKDLKAAIERSTFFQPGWAEAGFQISPVGKKDGQECFMVLLRDHIAPEARQGELSPYKSCRFVD